MFNQIENIKKKIKQFRHKYIARAKLFTYGLQTVSQKNNLPVFNNISNVFRTVNIWLDKELIQSKDIFIGEPVIYKIYYGNNRQLYGLDYFYIFCYLKDNSHQLNVYFQSVNPIYEKLTQEDYDIKRNKIAFEGYKSSFNSDSISVISVSDPGQFIPNLASSYYVGSPELNFPKLIAEVLEKVTDLSNISLGETLLFGSSAGTFGALLTSTYLHKKTNVLAVNSQINAAHLSETMQACLGIDDPEEIMRQFGEQVCCIRRFNGELSAVPNIYILANINDDLYQENFNFYKNYIEKFSQKGVNNQSVFDSYYGIDGHGRPEPSSLKEKIKLARRILTM